MKQSIRLVVVLLFTLLFTTATAPKIHANTPSISPSAHQGRGSSTADLVDVTALAANGSHTCVVTGGAVKCWGHNAYGQLGDGTYSNRAAPVQVDGLETGMEAVAAGYNHTCALTSGGGVKCWGEGRSGELGIGFMAESSPLPLDAVGLSSGVSAIAAGSGHTCALMDTGGVKCWGANWTGQLGNNSYTESSTPVDVSGLSSGVLAISANGFHTCAILTGGALKCWGYNGNGELGNNTTDPALTPTSVTGLGSGVTAIAVGSFHTCAVVGGAAKCWGGNYSGQLGDGTQETRLVPVNVTGLTSGVTGLAAGSSHGCARTIAGGVKCWGSNIYGQVGDGSTTPRLAPVQVSGLLGEAASLAAGLDHTCARMADGAVKCWGRNGFSQAGVGSPVQDAVPMLVEGITGGLNGLVAGEEHACLVTTTGGVKCWGSNEDGQVGDGTTTNRATPTQVNGLSSGVQAVTAGRVHSCALTITGEVKCWGGNGYGQLGNGSTQPSTTPVTVTSLGTGVKAIAAGEEHTCAVVASNGLKCWGGNWAGQLGNGTTLDGPNPTPGNVSGLTSGVTGVAAGSDHTCALVTGGGLKCWGDNYFGQVGDGSYEERHSPVNVSGLSNGVTSITAGVNHTCAVASGGAVKCWGDNGYGQGGHGSSYANTPTQVSWADSGYVTVGAGGFHTCGITTDGKVRCWGYNLFGQVGVGHMNDEPTLVDVLGLESGGEKIAGGYWFTCAEASDQLFCWGDNRVGQLGRVVPAFLTTPKAVVAYSRSADIQPASGPPGTVFRIDGAGFPAESSIQVMVNGLEIENSIETTESGNFVLFINTTGAAPGSYTLEISPTTQGSEQTGVRTAFFLTAIGQTPTTIGGGATVAIPGIPAGSVYSVYLPVVVR